MICGAYLAVMLGEGVSHFWPVQELVSNFPISPAVRLIPLDPAPNTKSTPMRNDHASAPVLQTGEAQRQFLEGLLTAVRALRNQNRNLIDQIAETNRDMMKMEFRLDTHSESFRPLPTSEDRGRGDISSTPDRIFPASFLRAQAPDTHWLNESLYPDGEIRMNRRKRPDVTQAI
jgi:hypothetical protein